MGGHFDLDNKNKRILKLEKELQDEYNKLSDLTIDQDKVFNNIDKINNKDLKEDLEKLI